MVKRIGRDEIARSAGQNPAMERAIAISQETCGSANLYSSIVTTGPGGRSEVHHHGDCETSIYVLRGRARFRSGEALRDVATADEGDFVYIAAHEIHVEENASDAEPLVVLRTRNCGGPVVHYVERGGAS